MITQKFNYQTLKQIKSNSGRLYQTPGGSKLPSVTTILNKTADKTFLKEWRKRVGDAEAKRITKTSTGLGTSMHKMLEDYLTDGTTPNGNIFAMAMANEIINKGIVNVDEVWGLEVSLFSENLYAGTTDCVGVHRGQSAIIDFKNSRRLKRLEWIEDYLLQMCAYAHSHNEMYGTDIKKGVIMLSTHDAEYQEFVIEGSMFDEYSAKWAKRVEQYFFPGEVNS